MATENITATSAWAVAHTSTADNTNVVLTPNGDDVNWVIDTTAPSPTITPHRLSEPLRRGGYRDRGFVLANGETLYIRGPVGVTIARTVEG